MNINSLLSKISIRQKITLLSALLGLFLLLTAAGGFYAVSNLDAELKALHKNELQQARLVNAGRAFSRAIEADMLQLLLANNTPNEQKSLRQKINESEQQRQEIFAKLDDIRMSDQEKTIYEAAKQSNATVIKGRQAALQLLESGNRAEAWRLYQQQAQGSIDKGAQQLKELADLAEQTAAQAAVRGDNLSHGSFLLLSFLTVIGLLIGAIAVFLISRAITAPLGKLVNEAQLISAGNLTGKNIPVAGNDEIARLTASFNEMKAHLQQLVSSSLQTAEQTAAASEELTASNEQCAKAATQTDAALAAVSEASVRQQTHVEQTSASIQEISAGIEEISATADNFAHLSDTTSASAREGAQTVQQAVAQIQSATEETATVQQLMGALSESSQKISDIVNVITGIADQTNLLALNAAIEAARAGEQGRGFSVVAEEVRKLAEDSSKAAHHIGELVQSNELQVAQVADSSHKAAESLQLGQQTVEQAGQQFSAIVQSITGLAKETHEISLAVEEAAKNAQNVVGSATLIDKETQKVSTQIQQISAAMQEQTSSLEEVASAGQSLANLADSMLTQVNRFQV